MLNNSVEDRARRLLAGRPGVPQPVAKRPAANDVIEALSAMERFFQGGKNWWRGALDGPDGRKCLDGAARALRVSCGNRSLVPEKAIADAKFYLQQAIAERGAGGLTINSTIHAFNDTRASYAEIAVLIVRAKQLAARRR